VLLPEANAELLRLLAREFRARHRLGMAGGVTRRLSARCRTMGVARRLWRVLDAVDYGVMQARLWRVDALYGPEPETDADRRRSRGRELRLRR
jgi:hypothetical protein